LVPLHARLLLFAIVVFCVAVTASTVVFTPALAPDRGVVISPNGIPNLFGPLPTFSVRSPAPTPP
jgi:hypothetical protein